MSPTYKAAKNKGREGWCVLFSHPARSDKDGKPARVRRGLGTRDESEADSLVAEMNRLLSDDTFWTAGARSRASREFDERVVSAFYGPLEAKLEDPFAIREDALPLLTLEGHTKVLLVGITGSGKTTVVRQIIGTDPERERFPSTATARTTIFDTEIILAPGAFRAVVSFRSQDRTRLYVDECVTAAVAAAAAGDSDAVVLRRLLEHSDLRFRLNYVLGGVRDTHESGADDGLDDGEEIKEPEADGISEEEREQNEQKVIGFLGRVRALAQTAVANLEADFQLGAHARVADREALLELVEDAIRDSADAQELVDDILDDVQERFALVQDGEFEREAGWPKRWQFESGDRLPFIKAVNQFSSNYAPRFGRLLTPLVSGIRVMGPFRPNWAQDSEVPSLVLLDTEGIGHTPESAMSIPTAVTKKYDLVDAILLVDNATQPLQAGAQAVLRSVIGGGHESKLATVFTHFEQVVGDNLPDAVAKKAHVLASFDSTLRTLEDQLGFVKGVRKRLETRVFFTAGINGVLTERARATRHNLNGLLEALQARPEPAATDAIPVYDMANLVLAARGATQEFHDIWHARVGLGAKAGVTAEHWARVKALTRRYAQQIEDYYGNLQPVADFIRLMTDRLARFVSAPREWKPGNAPEDARQAAVDRVARELYTRLHDLAGQRLFQDHVTEWMRAYAHRGAGSSRLRAIDVRGVYELAAPVPGETPAKESVDFLDALRKMFKDAAAAAGAETV